MAARCALPAAVGSPVGRPAPAKRLGARSSTRPHLSRSRAPLRTLASTVGGDVQVTNFQVETPDFVDEVLECPSLRHLLRPRPSPFVVHNNFGGGFVSDEDRVALSAIKFASAESAGAKCISAADGHNSWLEASMEQLCVPLPPWSLRAGARETIWFNPAEVNVAIVTCGGLCPGLNDVVQGLVSKSRLPHTSEQPWVRCTAPWLVPVRCAARPPRCPSRRRRSSPRAAP